MLLNREKGGFVYLLGSRSNTLYVGVTSDLFQRVWQHKTKAMRGFKSRYNIDRLLWFEQFGDIRDAIAREKEIKKWRRAKKLDLIEKSNPGYVDLAATWFCNEV